MNIRTRLKEWSDIPKKVQRLQQLQETEENGRIRRIREAEIKRLQQMEREITSAVQQLSERERTIVEHFFLHRKNWESICQVLFISKSYLYEILDGAIKKIGEMK